MIRWEWDWNKATLGSGKPREETPPLTWMTDWHRSQGKSSEYHHKKISNTAPQIRALKTPLVVTSKQPVSCWPATGGNGSCRHLHLQRESSKELVRLVLWVQISFLFLFFSFSFFEKHFLFLLPWKILYCLFHLPNSAHAPRLKWNEHHV